MSDEDDDLASVAPIIPIVYFEEKTRPYFANSQKATMPEIQDKEYYWVKPKETGEWEVAQAQKIRRLGFRPETFEFACALSGFLLLEHLSDIEATPIERPKR